MHHGALPPLKPIRKIGLWFLLISVILHGHSQRILRDTDPAFEERHLILIKTPLKRGEMTQ